MWTGASGHDVVKRSATGGFVLGRAEGIKLELQAL